jgi:DNA ligase (NAD+)
LKNLLDRASEAYYAGSPIMSDAAFDILAAHFNYNMVGHQVTGGLPHYVRMFSLQKVFDLADAPLNLDSCITTDKLDGAAISILYVDGKLSLALTRGDGEVGQDITDKAALLVPNTIETKGIVQVTGEVLAPVTIENARNLAAGSLNLKDLEEFAARPLTFVAYGISPYRCKTWVEDMWFLENQGFKVVTQFVSDRYPTDGVVYRINDNEEFESMGYTSKHPRGAFALKEQKEGEHTLLEDVVWQVGKSGVVSPVAILSPVMIGDALVSRATLHNIEYIRDLNLEIGCTVEVIRSGEIIPRVVRRVE